MPRKSVKSVSERQAAKLLVEYTGLSKDEAPRHLG